MKSDSIIRIMDSIYGKRDSFTIEEFNNVDTLLLSRLGYDNSVLEVDFNDLLNFSNLETLTVDGCVLDQNAIAIISKLKKLNRLSFYNCEIIEDIYPIFDDIHVKELSLCSTNFDLSLLKGNYNKLHLEDIEFKKLDCTVSVLDIFGCEINDFDSLFETSFDVVVVSSIQYLSNQLRFDDSGRKIVVMEDNGQFVSQKVGF